jgi:hypothetical protein
VFAVERGDLAGGPGQKFVEASSTHAVEGFMREAQARFGDEVEVDEALDRRVVGGPDVLQDDLLFLPGLFEGDRLHGRPVEQSLDGLAHGRFR